MLSPKPQSSDQSDVKLVSACPLCRKQYSSEDAYIVDEQQGVFLLHNTCKNCGSSIVAALVAGSHAVSTMGLVTDMTSEDVKKFKDAEPISCDDVIDCHAYLWGVTS